MKVVLPLARKNSLIVKEVDRETLVYDLETDQAHCLNDTAARVWKGCDGKTTASEIADRLTAEVGTKVGENVVWLALGQLEKFNLLDAPVAKPVAFLSGMSRRQAVRALGVAAIVLPMVSTLVVPTAAQSGSPTPNGECCNNPNECASNCCANDPNDPCAGNPDKVCIGFSPSPTGPVCQDLI